MRLGPQFSTDLAEKANLVSQVRDSGETAPPGAHSKPFELIRGITRTEFRRADVRCVRHQPGCGEPPRLDCFSCCVLSPKFESAILAAGGNGPTIDRPVNGIDFIGVTR
jgi:hypothetical protein